MEMDVSLKPMLGLIYKINKKLTFGFSYKDEIVADIDDFKANLDINLGTNGYPIPTLLAIMASWSPSVYRAGISYQTRYAEIELDIFREQWSRFNRGFIRDLRRVAPDFDDVCSFHLGYSFKINEGMNLFAGYVYAPTPVPEQPDTSNYLGSNRHIISCGGEKMIERPLGKIRFPIWLGLSLQNQLVEDRTFTKSDGSQYKVNGNIFSVLCSVRIFYDRT